MDTNIKKIVIYDFDSTLIASPTFSLENVAKWENATNEEWKHRYKSGKKKGQITGGWWSKIESLDHNIFDIKAIELVKDQAIRDINDPSVLAILLTGRTEEFSTLCKEIIEKNGIPSFDEYSFKPHVGKSTLKFKTSYISSLMKEYPLVDNIEMWEDRISHISVNEKDSLCFSEFGEFWISKRFNREFNINYVKEDNGKFEIISL